MLDLRQTPEYANYMKAIGWNVDKSQGFYVYIRRFPIIGNFIKIQRPKILSFEAIEQLKRKYKPFQVVIEPELGSSSITRSVHTLMLSQGYKLNKTYFVPSKTIQIDLKKSERQLLKEMHYKTRYNIKKMKGNKFHISKSKDIKEFADFWQKCALKQRGMFLSQKREIIEIYKAFGKDAQIISISNNSNTIAGVLILFTKEKAYYMYAASNPEGKKLFAPTLAAWESIKFAKKLKTKIFDFEGIYDERFPIKSWLGFTRFKKSFGGKIIEYPGTYSKFLLPFKLW